MISPQQSLTRILGIILPIIGRTRQYTHNARMAQVGYNTADIVLTAARSDVTRFSRNRHRQITRRNSTVRLNTALGKFHYSRAAPAELHIAPLAKSRLRYSVGAYDYSVARTEIGLALAHFTIRPMGRDDHLVF